MTNNVADHHPGNSVAEGNHEGDFGCSMVELRNLMELRSAEAVARLNDSYGSVQNVCKRLKTSPVEGKWLPYARGSLCLGASGMELVAQTVWSHPKPCGRWLPASERDDHLR